MTTSRSATSASIIVAVDEHPNAERAVQWASNLARLQGRALVITDTGPDDTAEARLLAASALASDVPTTSMSIADSARSAKTLTALASPYSLLVVGAHHTRHLRHGYKRPLTEAVARRARCPVVVVQPQPKQVAHHGVVVAVRGEVPPEASLRFAYDYASWTRTPLTVLHCFWDVTHPVGRIPDLATAPNEHRQLAEAVAGLGEDYPDVAAHLELAHGFPEHLIVEAGSRAEMVVLGSPHAGWFSALLEGSVEHWVLSHADCDVALVPVTMGPVEVA